MEEQELNPLSPQEAVRAFLVDIAKARVQLSHAVSDLVRALAQPDQSTGDPFESSVSTLNMAAVEVLKTSRRSENKRGVSTITRRFTITGFREAAV
jgi:hypothetical protein